MLMFIDGLNFNLASIRWIKQPLRTNIFRFKTRERVTHDYMVI